MLQRKQLLLDDKVTFDLIQMAREAGRSVSDLAREMLAEKIAERKKAKKRTKKMSAAKSLLAMVRAGKKFTKDDHGPADLSEKYDKYIY